MKPHESPRINKKSIRVDPGDSWPVWNRGIKDYRLESFLSFQYVQDDLCKHLGIYSSTDHPDRYWNLFLNAYINRHAMCMPNT